MQVQTHIKVVMEMTHEEAVILRDLLGRIAGDLRADPYWNALREALKQVPR